MDDIFLQTGNKFDEDSLLKIEQRDVPIGVDFNHVTDDEWITLPIEIICKWYIL